jgi:hypothetical protein
MKDFLLKPASRMNFFNGAQIYGSLGKNVIIYPALLIFFSGSAIRCVSLPEIQAYFVFFAFNTLSNSAQFIKQGILC